MNEYLFYYHEMDADPRSGEDMGMFVWYFVTVEPDLPTAYASFIEYKGVTAGKNIIQVIVKSKLH